MNWIISNVEIMVYLCKVYYTCSGNRISCYITKNVSGVSPRIVNINPAVDKAQFVVELSVLSLRLFVRVSLRW